MTRDLDPPITAEERALAEIGCKAAWEAHFRFGLPWPGADDAEQQHLHVVEMVAAMRAMRDAANATDTLKGSL